MATVINDSYTTRRCNPVTYDYSIIWTRRGNAIVWKAKVRQNAEFIGALRGRVDNPPADSEVTPLVKGLIESGIEQRLGMN